MQLAHRHLMPNAISPLIIAVTLGIPAAIFVEAGLSFLGFGINDPVPATPQCPFGGMKESGLGRELAHEGLEAYLETKYLAIKLRD